LALLAGVAADRWSRRRLMNAADPVRALAIASLVASISLDRIAFWPIVLVAPLGPPAAGFLLESVSARTTVAVFAACGLVLAVWGTVSPSIRKVPSLDALSS
jgi:hypothetical protein